MPQQGKNIDCIALFVSQASNYIQYPIVLLLFPILGAHVSEADFTRTHPETIPKTHKTGLSDI